MAVCVLMGGKVSDWKTVKKLIGDAKFVPSILDLKLQKKQMSNEDWVYEKGKINVKI